MVPFVTLYLNETYSWAPKWNNVKLYKIDYIGLKNLGLSCLLLK